MHYVFKTFLCIHTRFLYMITHILHTHGIFSRGRCWLRCASAHMFDVMFHTCFWHDHIYIWQVAGHGTVCTCSHVRCHAPHILLTWSHIFSARRGMLTFLCTCLQVRRYVPHMFSTWSHIPSGDTGMLTSLCSCSHAVTFSTCFWHHHIYVWQIGGNAWALAHMFDVTFHRTFFLTWSHIFSARRGMLTFLCTCLQVRRYVPHMFSTWSHIPSGDTGMLTSLCSCSHAVTFSTCFWHHHIYVWQIGGNAWALAHMFDVTFHIAHFSWHDHTYFRQGGGC